MDEILREIIKKGVYQHIKNFPKSEVSILYLFRDVRLGFYKSKVFNYNDEGADPEFHARGG